MATSRCFVLSFLVILWSVVHISGNPINEFHDQLKSITDQHPHVLEKGISWLLGKSLSMSNLTADKARIVFALQLALNDTEHLPPKQALQLQLLLFDLEIDILKALINHNQSFPNFNAGHLALAINAFSASHYDTSNFFEYDLISMLERKMEDYPTPDLNSYFAYSLGVLALCNSNRTVPIRFLNTLLKGMKPDGSYPFGTDEAALALMALSCIQDQVPKMFNENNEISLDEPAELPENNDYYTHNLDRQIHTTILLVHKYLISKLEKAFQTPNQNSEKLTITSKCLSPYTTGLILQALLSVNRNIKEELITFSIDCLLSNQKNDGSFGNILATFQILPVFNAANFLSVKPVKYKRHSFSDNIDFINEMPVLSEIASENMELNKTITTGTEISDQKRCLGNKYVKEELIKLEKIYPDFLHKAVSHLLNQWKYDSGWQKYTPQALVSMFLADPKWINPQHLESQLAIQIMKIQILSTLANNTSLKKYSIKQLAWYISALVATCHDPRMFYGHNLIQILKKKLNKYSSHYKSYDPLSFAILSLCNAGEMVPKNLLRILTAAMKNNGSLRSGITDTAITVMALACVKRHQRNEDIKSQLDAAVRYLRHHQKQDGHFATRRMDPTALTTAAWATQALIVTGVGNLRWDFPAAMSYLLQHQEMNGTIYDITTTLLILPLLNGKTFLDIQNAYCVGGPCFIKDHFENSSTMREDTSMDRSLSEELDICITFSIEDEVHHSMNITKEKCVATNSSAYQILQLLAKSNDNFKFVADTFSFGHYIHTVNGLKEDRLKNYYWMLYQSKDNTTPQLTSYGVDQVFPSNNDHLVLKYVKYGQH